MHNRGHCTKREHTKTHSEVIKILYLDQNTYTKSGHESNNLEHVYVFLFTVQNGTLNRAVIYNYNYVFATVASESVTHLYNM